MCESVGTTWGGKFGANELGMSNSPLSLFIKIEACDAVLCTVVKHSRRICQLVGGAKRPWGLGKSLSVKMTQRFVAKTHTHTHTWTKKNKHSRDSSFISPPLSFVIVCLYHSSFCSAARLVILYDLIVANKKSFCLLFNRLSSHQSSHHYKFALSSLFGEPR